MTKLTWSTRLEAANDRFLLFEYRMPSESLSLVRVILCGWLLLVGAGTRLERVDDLPDSFWDPPLGPVRLMGEIPPRWLLTTISIGFLCALVATFLGLRTSTASALAGTCLLVAETIENSFGKIDHGYVLVSVFLLTMSFSDWGDHHSVDAWLGRAKQRSRGWPLAITMLALSVMMMMAALPKISSGWLDPSFSAVQTRQRAGVLSHDTTDFLAVPLTRLEPTLLWEAADWVTVALEVSFLVLVWHRRRFRKVVATAAVFHLGVLLALNISFAPHLFVYAAVFDWSGRADKRATPQIRRLLALVLTAVVLATAGRTGAVPSDWLVVTPIMVAGGMAAAWLAGGFLAPRFHMAPADRVDDRTA